MNFCVDIEMLKPEDIGSLSDATSAVLTMVVTLATWSIKQLQKRIFLSADLYAKLFEI